MERAASIYEVARRAGVSHTTASNVLNRPGLRRHASAVTAERVRRVARDLGYAPHHAAQTLSRGKTDTIAFITHSSLQYAHVNRLIEELEAALEPMGYHLNLELLHHRRDEAEVYRALARGRCDGVISFDGTAAAPERMRELRRAGLPVVAIDLPRGAVVDTVVHDALEAARLGTAHLLERGHRRIAFVVDHECGLRRETRLQGIRQALAAAGLDLDDAQVYPWKTWAAPRELWQRIAAQRPLPTAVLCYNPELSLTLLMEIRRHGVRVPGEVALLSLGDHFLLPLLEVPITAVDSDHRQVAALAVERLLAQLQAASPAPPRQILVKPALHARASTRNSVGRPERALQFV